MMSNLSYISKSVLLAIFDSTLIILMISHFYYSYKFQNMDSSDMPSILDPTLSLNIHNKLQPQLKLVKSIMQS